VLEIPKILITPLDIWIKVASSANPKNSRGKLAELHYPPAVQAVEDFVDDFSRWYIRRSRNRISSGDAQALGTLYTVLFKFSKVAAPIIPFITEAIYQSLKAPGEALSVHLVDYPQVDEKLLKKHSDMLEKWLRIGKWFPKY